MPCLDAFQTSSTWQLLTKRSRFLSQIRSIPGEPVLLWEGLWGQMIVRVNLASVCICNKHFFSTTMYASTFKYMQIYQKYEKQRMLEYVGHFPSFSYVSSNHWASKKDIILTSWVQRNNIQYISICFSYLFLRGTKTNIFVQSFFDESKAETTGKLKAP